jgi:hypothetical protein
MIMDSGTKQLLAYSLTMMLLPSLALAQAQSATSPNSTGGETGQAAHEGASGDDAIYCRPPQQRTDFRAMGPKVCMTLGKWKELRAKGLDVSADGRSLQQMQNGPGAGSMGTAYDLRPQP